MGYMVNPSRRALVAGANRDLQWRGDDSSSPYHPYHGHSGGTAQDSHLFPYTIHATYGSEIVHTVSISEISYSTWEKMMVH